MARWALVQAVLNLQVLLPKDSLPSIKYLSVYIIQFYTKLVTDEVC
jgi:hypothetical protein